MDSLFFVAGPTDVELDTVDILQVHRDRVFPRVVVVDVASTMRSEVRAAILVIRDLVFPARRNPHVSSRVRHMQKEHWRLERKIYVYTLRRDQPRSEQTATSHLAAAEDATRR